MASEYIYAQLCQVAMLAFEAVNEAPMVAMESARNNLAGLAQLEGRLRPAGNQDKVLELATGAEAVRRSGSWRLSP